MNALHTRGSVSEPAQLLRFFMIDNAMVWMENGSHKIIQMSLKHKTESVSEKPL